MITREQLFVGLRLRDPRRSHGSQILIVTELTDAGFRYTWAERLHMGPRYGYSDVGEMFELGFAGLEMADTPAQKPAGPPMGAQWGSLMESSAVQGMDRCER